MITVTPGPHKHPPLTTAIGLAGPRLAVTAQYLRGAPEYTVFAEETETARSRTTQYGANHPKVSQALWTAIQAAITGTSSVSSALTRHNPRLIDTAGQGKLIDCTVEATRPDGTSARPRGRGGR